MAIFGDHQLKRIALSESTSSNATFKRINFQGDFNNFGAPLEMFNVSPLCPRLFILTSLPLKLTTLSLPANPITTLLPAASLGAKSALVSPRLVSPRIRPLERSLRKKKLKKKAKKLIAKGL